VILCHCYLDSMTLLAGPFRDVSMKVCELVRSMTFESCAHDPVAGCTRPLCSAIHSRVCCSCVLLKVDKLEKQIDHQNNKLQQMTHNLERACHALVPRGCCRGHSPSSRESRCCRAEQQRLRPVSQGNVRGSGGCNGRSSAAKPFHPSCRLTVPRPSHC
jgi:hypothetical protein